MSNLYEMVFTNKDTEYFWEYDYKFGTILLNSLFPNQYIRHYSGGGDGIMNILCIDGKWYDITLKQTITKSITVKKGNDTVKKDIISTLMKVLPDAVTDESKTIIFKTPLGLAKIEIVKKMSNPLRG